MVNDGSSRVDAIRIRGVLFRCADLMSAAAYVVDEAKNRRPVALQLSNAYCVSLARPSASYSEVFRHPLSRTFPDGAPVVVLMRLLVWIMNADVDPPVSRVRGPSLFREVLGATGDGSVRHYFLGSSKATLECLTDRLRSAYPMMSVAGTASPIVGADFQLTRELVEEIRDCSPDIIWVSLGTPKQDFVSVGLAEELGVVVAGVGAAFDFVAGSKREAPQLLQRVGLEWLYRLVAEPRRLWRRYLFGNTEFVCVALNEALRSTLARVKRRRHAGNKDGSNSRTCC